MATLEKYMSTQKWCIELGNDYKIVDWSFNLKMPEWKQHNIWWKLNKSSIWHENNWFDLKA